MVQTEPLTYGAEVGARVKARREELGMTQLDLEKASGVAQPQISRLENGGTDDPGIRMIRNLALALTVTVDWLTGMYTDDVERYLRQEPYIAERFTGQIVQEVG